jgi:hypothetical protein
MHRSVETFGKSRYCARTATVFQGFSLAPRAVWWCYSIFYRATHPDGMGKTSICLIIGHLSKFKTVS